MEYLHFVVSCIMKVEPTPTSLSTVTDPPISSIKDLQMLRPRPVPRLLPAACSSSFPKFMNSLEMLSCEIPTPESLILISNLIYLCKTVFLQSSNTSGFFFSAQSSDFLLGNESFFPSSLTLLEALLAYVFFLDL